MAVERYPYVDELPTPIRRVEAKHPHHARNLSGTVMVDVLVDTEGRVRGARIIQSCPPFDSVADAAARQWLFAPARSNGKPVAVHTAIPFKFSALGYVPNPSEAALAAGLAAERQKRWKEAIGHYIAGARSKAGDAVRVDYELHKKIIGLSRLAGASASVPAAAETAFARGRLLTTTERSVVGQRAALIAYAEASREAPWWCAPYPELARLQEESGNAELAVRSLRMYLLCAPDAADRKAIERWIARLTETGN